MTQQYKKRKNQLSAYDDTVNECLCYDKKSGVIHLFLTKKMHCKSDSRNIVSHKDAEHILTIHAIPKKMVNRFLKEMQAHKFIKIINRQKIRLLE